MNELVDVALIAPGCFGAASVFSHDAKVCQACPAFEQCAGESFKRLETIAPMIDVTDLMKRHQKAQLALAAKREAERPEPEEAEPALTEDNTPPAPGPERKKPVARKTRKEKVEFIVDAGSQRLMDTITNKKALALAKTIAKTHTIDSMKERLTNGENPFASSGPAFLRVAFAMMFAGGFTRRTLKERLVTEMDWTDGTAASHVSIAVSLLVPLQIAIANGDLYVLKPPVG